MSDFNYQEMDSGALKSLEYLSRKRILEQVRLVPEFSDQTYDQVRQHYKHYRTFHIFVEEYQKSKRYLQLDEVIDEIAANNGKDEDYFDKFAENARVFASIIEHKPLVHLYPKYVDEVCDLITESVIKGSSERANDELFRSIMASQISYANDCVDYFEQNNLGESDNIHNDIADDVWDTAVTHDEQNKDKDEEDQIDFTDLKAAQGRIMALIGTQGTQAEILQFLFSPTFGSQGSALIPPIASPIFVKILPPTVTQLTAKMTLMGSVGSSDMKHIYNWIRGKGDKTLQYLELLAQRAIGNADSSTIRDGAFNWAMNLEQSRSNRGEQTPSSFQNAFGEPDQPHGKDKGKKRQDDQQGSSGSGGTKADPPSDDDVHQGSSKKQQQQQQIPDDSNYHPEIDFPTLSVLAKALVKEAKSKPATELFHDHMTRFSTKDESPRPVSRIAMRKGKDADYFVMELTQAGIRQYVVTFTRKSRKPIFNMVS